MSDKKKNKKEEEIEKEAEHTGSVIPLRGLYENWFLDYASYVILERAVPMIDDGLKPVQRRILHAMKELDDGRFNKIANVVGSTMQYHPHGDASINDAIVNIGQKDLMIETQGNWGDFRTGDKAAAPRYIEGRLSKFALEVAFNPQTTEWQATYDGRKKEPVALPMKFPLLLAQGVEGIAVGLSTKILPHNFNEILKACIEYLKGRSFKLLPDFATGGMIDVSEYNHGKRGGKVKVRAKIEIADKKTLLIKEIPYGTTTSNLIDSIIKANDKGKIKIKKVVDNTAKEVEIAIELASGVSPSVAIDALYAFTDCQSSISPNACVVVDNKPLFMSVNDILKMNTDQTVALLKRELEIRLHELQEKWHFSSLEKIFIENRIYRDIEECETWEAVIEAIDKGLKPFKKQFYREVTEDDIVRLTEIKIKRISKYDSFKADELIIRLEEEMKQVKHDLKHLTEFAINYFQHLMDKYGKGRERKTEIIGFDQVVVQEVVANNAKLYVDRKEGFIGYGKDLKKTEFIKECSDIDDIIVFMQNGEYKVVKNAEKVFVGNNIIHVDVWKKGNDRMIYNAIYRDGKTGRSFAKRFAVIGVTRDKAYNVTKGAPMSKVLYFSANANGEAEKVSIKLTQSTKARIKVFDFDFAELEIKGKSSKGNTVTKYPVRKITLEEEGVSTLSGRKVWIDEAIGKFNTEARGRLIGSFNNEDTILIIYSSGEYEMVEVNLNLRLKMKDVMLVEKFNPEDIISVIHYGEEKKCYFVKRFKIETASLGQRFLFIGEKSRDKLEYVTNNEIAEIEYVLHKGSKASKPVNLKLHEFVDVKGWKAMGNKLTGGKIRKITEIDLEQEVAEDSDCGTAIIEEAVIEQEVVKKTMAKKSTKAKSSAKKPIVRKTVTKKTDVKKPSVTKSKANAKPSTKKKTTKPKSSTSERPAPETTKTAKANAKTTASQVRKKPGIKTSKSPPKKKENEVEFEITNLGSGQGELF